ncbi:TSC22 domain family protein 3-like [Denticeps clupeoides]|uniref:TSC22 domain family protein 3-like n=1 Tax=Denticeps clupeoides TaxID=299321 RepID=UPI0010A4AF61|nr:TSC22 domain family protein 3-like [Denticeps clupeoides]
MFGTSVEVGVYQLHNFSISFFSSLLEGDVVSVKMDNSASGCSVVAVDNKIDEAIDLVKSHVMFAVREEVEVLKKQVRELSERNVNLERENSLLRMLTQAQKLQECQYLQATD